MVRQYTPEEPEGSGGIFGGRPPLPIIGGVIGAIVIGIILVMVAIGSGGGENGGNGDLAEAPSFGSPITGNTTPVATGTSQNGAEPVPDDTPVPQPTGVAPGDKISMPSIGANGTLVHLTVPPDNVMPAPSGAREVAIYSFQSGVAGAIPGQGRGNIIMAGHVDLASVGPAVFWNLRNIKAGDTIELEWQGQTYRYSVSASFLMSGERSNEWGNVLAPTSQEVLTLITCEGEFNAATRQYSARRVVQATRIF